MVRLPLGADAFDFAAGEDPAPESFPAVIPYFAQALDEQTRMVSGWASLWSSTSYELFC